MNENIDRKLHELMGNCLHTTRFRTDKEREWIPGFLGFGGNWKYSGVLENCLKCGEPIHSMIYNGKAIAFGFVPSYSTSISDAMEAVGEAVRQHQDWKVVTETDRHCASVVIQKWYLLKDRYAPLIAQVDHESLPTAITLALIEALTTEAK